MRWEFNIKLRLSSTVRCFGVSDQDITRFMNPIQTQSKRGNF